MIRRPPRSTQSRSSAASDVYKRQLQGYWETKEWERQKRHGVWEKILIDIKYYEFIAVIGKARIKVIIKKIEKEGSYIFWSVIPFWKMNKETSKRILHDEII